MKRVLILLAVFFSAINICYSSTLHVGKNKPYKTIKSALNAANDGDSILVYEGTYREGNIEILKRIKLIGINYPVLDGEKKYEIVSVKIDNVTVSGFKLINSGISSIVDIAGIKIYNTRNVYIKNNILSETFFGIYVQNSIKCEVINNKLSATTKIEQNNGNGIHSWKSDSLTITNNTIVGHRDGMYFEFTTHTNVVNNISRNNLRYGLHFMFSHNNRYITNIFENNGAGVAVMYSNHVTMIGNKFLENWGDGAYGLLLKEITDSYVSNNLFFKNTIGIYLEGATRINMKGNVFKRNGWAMKIMASCLDVSVIKNNFLSNTFDVGTNGSVSLNDFKNNYWDKYEGYDINKDGIGDVPYRPVSLFATIIENNPPAMILFRSFMATLLDKTEKIIPTLTPENLKDDFPLMKPLAL